MPTLRLTKSQMEDIAAVCAFGPERLPGIARAIGGLPLTIKRSAIRAAIADEVGDEQARPLVRLLFGLATANRRGIGPIGELMDGVRQTLANQKWEPDDLARWDACRPLLEQLLRLPTVVATAKALDLSYDFARLCMATRILTDIRPVFDEENGRKTDIIGTTITQTLRIDYNSPAGSHQTISFALDLGDIRQLRSACEEAIAKAEKARQLIEDGCQMPTTMPGEEE
jgi:Sec-independent protein translocase protein TatA